MAGATRDGIPELHHRAGDSADRSLARQPTCPGALESIEVGGGHVTSSCRSEVEDGLAFDWDAIGVLGDQELVVGTVDGVVQDGPVQPDLGTVLA